MARNGRAAMVADDDPDFARFWTVYPLRVSKKDARVAWMQLTPSPAVVERILAALAWQVPLWAALGYGTPYPASYLRAERWTDEPPRSASSKHVPSAADPWWYASCPHTPKCGGVRECGDLQREANR